MFKLLLAFSVLILTVVSGPVPPSPGVIKADLLAAGLSEQAADGVLKVASEFFKANKKEESVKRTSEETGALFRKFLTEVDIYIKTQSAEDQEAYKEFADKKKADFEAHLTAKNH
ncbi:hypothetical protein GCK72_020451 [Caenorhabditis remanei]|uniref:Uncharacterized protein n=1 Tax=Caenorhabditis remanei TaxID=31234 RepID=A0A6A5GGL0_CAERE|nr:hypothetical protein GCK72_020451 [Caenorhabditis remanei]KAF1753894.1 hypothetical protein GCK72_020451 [Caenorhabditis remanei]